MPLMAKDVDIEAHPWLRASGLTMDQFSHIWTYSEGESAPRAGQYRNLADGKLVELPEGGRFPEGRWAGETDLPGPRYNLGSEAREITG